MAKNLKRVCIVTTIPQSLYFLHKGLFEYFRKQGWDITGIAANSSKKNNEIHKLLEQQNVKMVSMPFIRHPSLLKDLWCLFRLWCFFLFNRFDIVHCSTPKAMLLGTVAAFFSGHRAKIVTMHGRVYENYTGWKRKAFVAIDNFIYRIANKVIPVCKELGESIVKDGCPPSKIVNIGPSNNGVDSEIFTKNNANILEGKKLREKLNIPQNALVILSVGRLREEKGINELVAAFKELSAQQPIHLVLLGPRETHLNPLTSETEKEIESNPNIHYPGKSNNTVPWYAMADIVAFPTYREGFGNISIEASAMELPIVGSNIMGLREGIIDGKTGILVPVKSIKLLAHALQKLIDHPELRKQMGIAGRQMAVTKFNPQKIWDKILELDNNLSK